MTTVGPSVWTGRALQAKNDGPEMIGLALLYPARERNCCVPGHHGYPRARSHSRLGPERQKGHLITNALARPFLHLPHSGSQTSAGKPTLALGSAKAVPSEPPSLARQVWRATVAMGGGGHLPIEKIADELTKRKVATPRGGR